MNTSDADFKRFLDEYALENQRKGRLELQLELAEMIERGRSKRNTFSLVGEFIQLMFVALKQVGEGIVDVIKLLRLRLKERKQRKARNLA